MNLNKKHIDGGLSAVYKFTLDERSRPFTFLVRRECKIKSKINDDGEYEFEFRVPCNKEFDLNDIDIYHHRDAKQCTNLVCEVKLKSSGESIFIQNYRQDNNCDTFDHLPYALAQVELYDTLIALMNK
jgi:hypothetical protein